MIGSPQLFGTDGVRGVAGEYPLDRPTIGKLGRALGQVLARRITWRPLQVVLGEDTRESSSWISRALAAGLRSNGIEISYAGVITTPGIAFLTRHHGFAAGVMVSASHNPYQDNGIKVLSSSGTKFSEIVELEIERALSDVESPDEDTLGRALVPLPHLLDDYIDCLQSIVLSAARLPSYRLVVDCANGSACRVAPELLRRLGMEARIRNAAPSGRNINQGSGSLHPEKMAEETRSWGADLGVAFDGDGDRAIFSTREGRVADGDHVLYAVATFFKQHGLLKGGAVVGTLMTNLGLELALARHGIGLKRTPVGDKFVYEEMQRSEINLGGEPSGHIIFSDLSPTGDGIITLLEVLRVLAETGRPLEELVCELQPFPQIIRNVRVREKPLLESIPGVARAMEDWRREFGERGRLVVRYSGTEPLARVMVEAEHAEVVERYASRIAGAIREAIGAR